MGRLALAGVVLLVGLVAVAAAASSERAPLDQGVAAIAGLALADLLGTVLVLGTLVLVVWLLSTARRTGGFRASGPRRRRQSLGAALVLLVVAGLLAWWLPQREVEIPEEREEPPEQSEPIAEEDLERLTADEDAALLARGVAVGTGVLLVAGVGLWLWRRRDPAELASPAEDEPDAVDAAVAASTEPLASIADPGEAVREAYRRMLAALEAAGHPRHASEGPFAYLERVLAVQRGGDPARELTELFALARYSAHPLDDGHRERARVALAALRRDVDGDAGAVDGDAAPADRAATQEGQR